MEIVEAADKMDLYTCMNIPRIRLAFRDFMRNSRRDEQYLFLQRYIGHFDKKITLVLNVDDKLLQEVNENFLKWGCVNELNVESSQKHLSSASDFENLFRVVYQQVASEVFPIFLRTGQLSKAAGDLEAILEKNELDEYMSNFRKKGVVDLRQLQHENYTDPELYRDKFNIKKLGVQKRLCRIVNKELNLLLVLHSEER